MNALHPEQVEVLKLNLDQVRVLASVPCSEVFSSLDPSVPRSAREIAEEIERSPASVSEHLAKLLEVGLIITSESRKRRSRTESMYLQKGLVTRFVLSEQSEESIEQYKHRFKGQMRQAERQHDAVYSAIVHDPTFTDFLIYKHHALYLNRESALRLKLAVSELQSLVQELSEPNPEARETGDYVRVHFTALMLPTQQESFRRS